MPSLVEVAGLHARTRRRLAQVAAGEAARLWSQVDPQRVGLSWLSLLPRLLVLLTGAQTAAAGRADGYLDEVLDAQGIPAGAVGRVSAAALAGVASDGRDLAGLLYQPAVRTLVGIQRGASVGRALAGGGAGLDMLVRTQVADAGRVADQVALTARPAATGYVRMLVGGGCSRCAILAGRRYAYNAGFDRHPRCLPAGVVVSGPKVNAATRRLYQGELVVISTASGQELPITGNHPVLTDRGWLPANLVEEGDYVVRSTRRQGASALVVPDEDQVPARIEDLWRPDGVMPLLHVPTTPEDFHGDGGHGDVGVVLSDRLLGDWGESSLPQHVFHELVSSGVVGALDLPVSRSGDHELIGVPAAPVVSEIGGFSDQLAPGLVGLLPSRHRLAFGERGWAALPELSGTPSLLDALLGSHLRCADEASRRVAADLHSERFQSASYDISAYAEARAEAVFALAGYVRGGDLAVGQDVTASRWDPPAGPLTVESRLAYAERGQDLVFRLAGQVELDRVVQRRRVQWSGHVYNLTSAEGWYSANGLIVSNCDCVHVPAREDTADEIRTDPKKYFASLSREEQDRQFTKAGAEAIRLGADLNQIVNSRRGARGLTTAGARVTGDEARMLRGGRDRGRLEAVDVYGRQLFITSEGVTTRGVAGKRLGARETGEKVDGGRYRSAKPPRLMPESVLQIAGDDRAEAQRLLRRFGYLTD